MTGVRLSLIALLALTACAPSQYREPCHDGDPRGQHCDRDNAQAERPRPAKEEPRPEKPREEDPRDRDPPKDREPPKDDPPKEDRQNPGNDKETGHSRHDGKRGEEPSGKGRRA